MEGSASHPEGQEPVAPHVELRRSDRLPDITVEIIDEACDGRSFEVAVSTPHIPAYEDLPPEPWILPTTARQMVADYMTGLTDEVLEPQQLRSRIVGFGTQLFTRSPRRFQELYWLLTDSGRPPRSILVQSEEDAIPWELMTPHRPRRGTYSEIQQPLGFQLALGRWVGKDGLAPPQVLQRDDGYVFAPRYRRGSRLRHSPDEVSMVCSASNGDRIQPGTQRALEAALASRAVSILHFTCHGETTVPPVQAIMLEKNGRLLSYELPGMEGLVRALYRKRPMVFLNVCEVGRPLPSLIGVGGFATAFVELGARCVIAPFWSVKDSVAFDVAQHIYGRIVEAPEKRIADTLSEVRRLSFEKDEDSYAAYAYYGDPLSSFAD